MDPRYTQEEDNMLDFESKVINRELRVSRGLLSNDVPEYTISSANVMPKDGHLTSKISSLSLNDGTVQQPPDNKSMNEEELMTLTGVNMIKQKELQLLRKMQKDLIIVIILMKIDLKVYYQKVKTLVTKNHLVFNMIN